MLNLTDQYSCISPAASKGGFSCHPGDLSRKCHLCHGSCVIHGSETQGLLPRVIRQSETFCDYFVSQQTELIQRETPQTSITDLICEGT